MRSTRSCGPIFKEGRASAWRWRGSIHRPCKDDSGRVASRLLAATSKKSLQDVGGNTRVADLMRRAGGGGEPLHLVAACSVPPDGL
jgi:hypothetical protein